jgi:hypothetical protein
MRLLACVALTQRNHIRVRFSRDKLVDLRQELLLAEWLVEDGSLGESPRERFSTMAGDKYEGNAAAYQFGGDFIDGSTVQIGVEERPVEQGAFNELQSIGLGAGRSHNVSARVLQVPDDIERNQGLILDDEKALSGQPLLDPRRRRGCRR